MLNRNYIYGPYSNMAKEQTCQLPENEIIAAVIDNDTLSQLTTGSILARSIAFCESAFSVTSGDADAVDAAFRKSPLYSIDWYDQRIDGFPRSDYILHRAFLRYLAQQKGFSLLDDESIEASIPHFPENVFPEYIEKYVDAVCRNVQVPREMAAPMALAALAMGVVGKYVVCMPNNHLEPLPIYLMIISESGTRKSSVLRQMLGKPISIAEQILGRRLVVNDATPEALIASLEKNREKMSIVAAEGGILNTLCGNTYTKSPNLNVLLQSYDAEKIEQVRIMREGQSLEHPELAICLAVQSVVATKLHGNNYLRENGLTSRFLFALPPSLLGTRKWSTDPIPEIVARTYVDRIVELLTREIPSKPQILYLSTEADHVIGCFFDEIEATALDNPNYGFDGSARAAATAVRIAGLLHIADNLITEEIGKDEATRAIKITRYFLSVAKILFRNEGLGAKDNVSFILQKCREYALVECTTSDFHAHCRRRFEKVDDLKVTLREAENKGYIKITKKPAEKSGPPTHSFIVNPLVFM